MYEIAHLYLGRKWHARTPGCRDALCGSHTEATPLFSSPMDLDGAMVLVTCKGCLKALRKVEVK